MSILVDERTRLVVQGITGNEGTFHTLRNRRYGTSVVAGVTPGKGGQDVDGIPVFDTVARAVAETGANTSMIFVPPRFAAEAILEAADAGVGLVVCITEGIPVRDMAKVHSYLEASGTRLVGPNCPGVISPGAANVGIIPGRSARRARSGSSPAAARSCIRSCTSSRSAASASPPVWAWAGIPSTASGSSRRWSSSRRTPRPS